MKILSELRALTKHLKPYEGNWALCGGVVASIYRASARFTNDIDIAIVDGKRETAKQAAKQILLAMGKKPMQGFIPDPHGGSGQRNALICAREDADDRFIGIDFLLPVFPWVQKAVERAQDNKIDYGFAKLATVTVEDLILAKLNALEIGSRPQDSDDIRSILEERKKIDATYIRSEAAKVGIRIPRWVEQRLVAV